MPPGRPQIDYAAEHHVPWGISESAYNLVDRRGHYQYKAFGVPGLGLKRGLGDELVVAPYATALALMVDPGASIANLRRLVAAGLQGEHGFFDAIDYTRRTTDPTRTPRPPAWWCPYLAHHQGMTLVALANVLKGDRMVDRFHADPRVQATELCCRSDCHAPSARSNPGPSITCVAAPAPLVPARRFRTHTNSPHTQFLSNGNYVTSVTNAGGGEHLARTSGHEMAPRCHSRRLRPVHLPS